MLAWDRPVMNWLLERRPSAFLLTHMTATRVLMLTIRSSRPSGSPPGYCFSRSGLAPGI